MTEEVKAVAVGRVVTALLIWTCDETRNIEMAMKTMRALPIETLREVVDNMKSVVDLAEPILEERDHEKAVEQQSG